jgi:DNA-binding response OmpR family regulator
MTLDMLLPDGDGAEFLREIREDERTATLPVVIVTVKRDTGEILGNAVGVVDWLTKPIDAQRLLTAIRQCVSSSAARPQVLHVEDDVDVRQITSAIVGAVADVTPAGTLKEAREKLRQSHFELAILDIGLPDGSGLDLLPLLNSAVPPTTVILFSAREPDDVDLQAVRGALVKSRTSNRALLETIRRSLKLPTENLTGETSGLV